MISEVHIDPLIKISCTTHPNTTADQAHPLMATTTVCYLLSHHNLDEEPVQERQAEGIGNHGRRPWILAGLLHEKEKN